MLDIHKVDTRNPDDVERFVQFPFRLYRDSRFWVPPLVSGARKQLDRERNPYFEHSDADFFLALRDGEIVGRIAVLNPRRRNEHRGRHEALFYLFEVDEDPEAARLLFDTAFEWAREQGLEKISGPEGFLPGDGLGLLVKGFDHHPAMGISYNYDYYDRLVREAGFEKQTDYYSCYLSGDIELPERFCRVAKKVKERRGFEVLRFQSKDEMRAFVPRVVEAYNAAFSENRGFVPVTGEEAEVIAGRLLDMTQPDLIKVVAKGDEIVGFLFGFPDVWKALRRCRGRLYPFGWALLLWESRRTRWINFNGAGILPQHQGLGVNAVLYYEMYKTVKERGFLHTDLVQINEANDRMVKELEALGADFYKTHRIYERAL